MHNPSLSSSSSCFSCSSCSTMENDLSNNGDAELIARFEQLFISRQHVVLQTSPSLSPPKTGTDNFMDINSMQPQDIMAIALNFSRSWFLREVLVEKNAASRSIIFNALIGHIVELAIHPSGSNVLMSLIQESDVQQLHQIISNLILPPSIIIGVSLHSTGSKTIQRVIQQLKKSPLIKPVVTALSTGFFQLMQDQHGGMVIQKCLAQLSSQENEVLYIAAIVCCVELATHVRGCIELNDFISGVSGPYRDLLLHTITDKTVFLSQDPRGNFVIQYILELQHPVFTRKICNFLVGYYTRLSVQKSGSHVVEKCLTSSEMSTGVLDLLSSKRLCQVAHDQYGNYVIQTALKVTKNQNRLLYEYLLRSLEPHLKSLASHLHGKNVFKLIKNAPLM